MARPAAFYWRVTTRDYPNLLSEFVGTEDRLSSFEKGVRCPTSALLYVIRHGYLFDDGHLFNDGMTYRNESVSKIVHFAESLRQERVITKYTNLKYREISQVETRNPANLERVFSAYRTLMLEVERYREGYVLKPSIKSRKKFENFKLVRDEIEATQADYLRLMNDEHILNTSYCKFLECTNTWDKREYKPNKEWCPQSGKNSKCGRQVRTATENARKQNKLIAIQG